MLVVALLDGGGDAAGHADAVAAHHHRDVFAFFIGDSGVHGFGVLRAEHKDMPDLDAAAQVQSAFAVRGRIAFLDIAQIKDLVFGDIAIPVDVDEVAAVLVGAAGEVAHASGIAVDEDAAFKAHRPQRARMRAGEFGDLLIRGELDFIRA